MGILLFVSLEREVIDFEKKTTSSRYIIIKNIT